MEEQIERNWREFDGTPNPTPSNFYVSMSRRGEIVMNRRAFAELSSPDAVIMLFDPATDTIGLRPTERLTPNAFPLKLKGDSAHRVICARPFAERHDIRLGKTVRFPAARIENGIMVLELRSTASAERGPRARGKRR